MTAKVGKTLIVMLVLATVLLAGNALVGGRADTKAMQAGTCCKAANVKDCLLGNAESCCPAQTCPVPCPGCCCANSCAANPHNTTSCSTGQQKPCCASK